MPGSIPTSELTFNAKVTSRGAMNSREVLMNASVYSEMKPHPTRCAAGDSGSSAASAAVRYFNPSSPAVGRQPRAAGRGAALRPGNVGHCALLRRQEPGERPDHHINHHTW